MAVAFQIKELYKLKPGELFRLASGGKFLKRNSNRCFRGGYYCTNIETGETEFVRAFKNIGSSKWPKWRDVEVVVDCQ